MPSRDDFKQMAKARRSNKGANKARANYAADFETTTDAEDCRVWAWGLSQISHSPVVEMGTDIESFIERISSSNSTCYFHNLKFDGVFVLDYLLNNGYEHVVSDGPISSGTFKSLISDMGQFYSITVRWDNGHNTEFRDSYKKIPLSVSVMADSFHLAQGKGELDYKTFRPIGHQLTPEEADYLRLDVAIVAEALAQVIEEGMSRLTVASDALSEYKTLMGSKAFSRMFPVLPIDMDSEIRRAYRGGFTYAADRFRGMRTCSGLVLDVNSLYPAVMRNYPIPFGEPQWEEGRVEPSKERPLTIFSVTFTAKLKKDHIPCIQIKGSSMFQATEYLKVISEPTTLMVTNIDWQLYLDHYDIDVLEWGGGWKFHAVEGLFDRYIDKWSAVKIAETGGKKQIAKLFLNSLYGRFATNPRVGSKVPTLKDGVVKLVRGTDETRDPVYTAAGVFITSYARDITIRAAQQNYQTFAYADTDSLHLLQDEVPDTIDVHPSRMGAWKLEYKFEEAFYIRPKAYLEKKWDGSYQNAIAGLPVKVTSQLTFEDVIDGKILHGKMHPKTVKGGIVLQDVEFKLKL